jgi:hypothetical protein
MNIGLSGAYRIQSVRSYALSSAEEGTSSTRFEFEALSCILVGLGNVVDTDPISSAHIGVKVNNTYR